MQAKPTPISRPTPDQVDAMADDFDQCLAVLVAEGSFPSFDEFKKNPDKYREHPEALFEAIDGNTRVNRKEMAKAKYYWRDGKESFPLEKLQRVCMEHGYSYQDVDMLGQRRVNDSGTGKDVMHVRVFPKAELRAMGAVVPNE